MAILSDAQKVQASQGISWNVLRQDPVYKSLIDSGVLQAPPDESGSALIDPNKVSAVSTAAPLDPMKLSPDQYRQLITSTGAGIHWDDPNVQQNPLLKTLIDEGVLKKQDTGLQGEAGENFAQLDWSQLPQVTGGLSQQQLDQIHGHQIGFSAVGPGTEGLVDPKMIFNDPLYGKLTLNSNVQQTSEGGFWKYAPYLVQAIAAVATGGASLSLTAGQTLAEQLPNIARMLSDWQASQNPGG